MRRLLLALTLCLLAVPAFAQLPPLGLLSVVPPSGGGGTIALRGSQFAVGTSCGSSCNSNTVTLPASTASGDGAVVSLYLCNDVSCFTASSADPVTSVTVDGNSCSHVPGTFQNTITSGTLIETDIWLCSNITSGSGVATVNTGSTACNSGGSCYYTTVFVSEWTCGGTHCSVDTGLGNHATTTTSPLSLPTAAATTAPDLIYSLGYGEGVALIANQTQLSSAPGNISIDEYQIASSGSVFTNGYVLAGSGTAFGSVAAIKP
jgi:hypothetical protein